MIIIRPVDINDAVLTTSDVPEADESEWLVGTSYPLGARVMVTSATEPNVHSIYVSLQGSNLGNQPWDDDLVNPVWWARESATNRWAMFSDQISDQTEKADSIDVELLPGALVNSVAFFNLEASSIRVRMNDPTDGDVYDETVNLVDDSGVNDWYAWYFEPVTRQQTLALLDLPPYVSASIFITINNPGNTAACGLFTMGAQRVLGETDYGTGVGIVDYSRKDRDTFGNPVVTKRNFTKRADYTVTLDTGYVNTVENTLAELRTTPMTWIGSVNFPSTIIYGYYRDFDIVLGNVTKSQMTIDVEGLT